MWHRMLPRIQKEDEKYDGFYEVPLYFYSDKESLGRQIGKEYRSMVAVTHPGFSDSIEKQLKLYFTTE